jgi:hypothetical protein
MADDRCFGQSGGARGKYIKRRIACHQTRPPLNGRIAVGGLQHSLLKIELAALAQRGCGRVFRVGPQPIAQALRGIGSGQQAQALFADQDELGTRRLYGVHQRLTADVGVQEHQLDADFGQSKPSKQKGWPVFHAQSHHIATAQTQCLPSVGHLVHAGVGLGIGVMLGTVANARALGKLNGAGLHPLGERVVL